MEPMADHDFGNADSPKERLDQCAFLFLRHLHEPRENCLRFIVEEAQAQKHLARQVDPGLDDALAGILSDASPILSDSSSGSFEILFDSYVSYTVTNESYGTYPQPPEVFKGKLYRCFEWSHLLQFTKVTSYACDEYPGPGPLLHSEVVCLNHVIDVIATTEPVVRILEPKETPHVVN
jgi:hypothetical protein